MNLRMGQEAGIMELSPLQGMGETHQVKKKLEAKHSND